MPEGSALAPAGDAMNALKMTSTPKQASSPAAAAPQAPAAATAPAPAPAAVAPATSGMTPMGQVPGGVRFTGHPISLDFQGADLRAVLRTFAEISGLNVVIDPTIQGTVDVALRDVPWDQALDIILRANKLGYSVDGTIVRVAPLAVLADEEGQRRKLQEEQALAGELRVMTRALSYARAEEVAPLLTRTVLSQRGQIQTDGRTNTIIINDLADRLEQANELIATLDQPQPQVEIEARIVQTTRDFARTLGVQWGLGARASQALGNTLPFAFPNQGSLGGRVGGLQGPITPDPGTDAANTVVNLAAPAASTGIGLALGAVNGAINLDVALSALERSGQGRLLSTPRVSTQNNIEAEITQGIQIPIQTVANNTVTVTFKDAALTLKVTPQITAADTVIMRIQVENASPDFSRSVGGIPPIDTQRAITQVLVSNGETTVIGGIYISREQATQDRTPGLHRLPLLGWLFRRDGITDESRELLIFITPRIIRL
jgi:type IV pilus assembly protein PilQ